MSMPVILLGSGGHAKVLLGMLSRLDVDILGIVDPHRAVDSICFGVRVLGADDALLAYPPECIDLVNGIGSLPGDSGIRSRLFKQFTERGYRFKTVIDPCAFVAGDVDLGEGVQVMAGAIVQAGGQVAENCIINSGAIVEHDCRLGRHVHVAPGAVLSGGVDVGENVHIGTGAAVIQGIRIGEGSVVGAGSVVTRDVDRQQIVYSARSFVRGLSKE